MTAWEAEYVSEEEEQRNSFEFTRNRLGSQEGGNFRAPETELRSTENTQRAQPERSQDVHL